MFASKNFADWAKPHPYFDQQNPHHRHHRCHYHLPYLTSLITRAHRFTQQQYRLEADEWQNRAEGPSQLPRPGLGCPKFLNWPSLLHSYRLSEREHSLVTRGIGMVSWGLAHGGQPLPVFPFARCLSLAVGLYPVCCSSHSSQRVPASPQIPCRNTPSLLCTVSVCISHLFKHLTSWSKCELLLHLYSYNWMLMPQWLHWAWWLELI